MASAVCGEELKETFRRPNGEERFCFICRKKRQFEYVVLMPVNMWSYYGPSPHIECTTCHKMDADLFPGYSREWED